jgi:hypothetical protein
MKIRTVITVKRTIHHSGVVSQPWLLSFLLVLGMYFMVWCVSGAPMSGGLCLLFVSYPGCALWEGLNWASLLVVTVFVCSDSAKETLAIKSIAITSNGVFIFSAFIANKAFTPSAFGLAKEYW